MQGKDAWPVVLVTGAGAGLGFALACELWDHPYRLALASRTGVIPARPLEENDRCMFLPLDVRRPQECVRVVEGVHQRWGRVDVLVNNAGMAYRSVLEHMSWDEYLDQFAVNFLGAMELTRLVLPGMRARRSGRIINVSSVGGMMAMPTMGPYSASKYALEGASEALWYEMKPWGIHVSLVQPGFIHSKAFRKVCWSRAGQECDGGEYARCYAAMSRFVEKLMEASWDTPDRVARKIHRVIRKRNPRLRVPVTLDAWFFYFIRRMLPRRLYHALLYANLPGRKTWIMPAAR